MTTRQAVTMMLSAGYEVTLILADAARRAVDRLGGVVDQAIAQALRPAGDA